MKAVDADCADAPGARQGLIASARATAADAAASTICDREQNDGRVLGRDADFVLSPAGVADDRRGSAAIDVPGLRLLLTAIGSYPSAGAEWVRPVPLAGPRAGQSRSNRWS